MGKLWLGDVLRRVHEDEGGAVTLETILIIGAIAIPILLFLLKVAWPQIQTFFNTGVQDLQTSADNVSAGNAGN
jgi:Flp pilus assembly pilin Flp